MPKVKTARRTLPPTPTQKPELIIVATNKNTPVAKWVRVTPALATQWLEEANTNNRAVRDDHVTRLAADMAAGKWKGENGEAIRFDRDNRLVDGQHRLWACIVAEKPFETLLITNLDPEVYSTIGVGRPKNFGDFLGPMHGEKNTSLLAATIRLCYFWQNGLLPVMKTGRNMPTIQQLEETLRCHPKIRESVARISSMNETRKLLTSSFAALIHYAGVLEGRAATVESFMERLGNGLGLTETDAVYHLRKFLLGLKGPQPGNRRPGQHYILGLAIKAWNASKRNQPVQALRYMQTESFPQL